MSYPSHPPSPPPSARSIDYFEYRPSFVHDGQASPLDTLVRTTRSTYKPSPGLTTGSTIASMPFLSPLSVETTRSASALSPGGQQTASQPNSPLLHTRFGSPSKCTTAGRHTSQEYAYSDVDDAELETRSEVSSVYTASPTSPSGYKPFSYLLDELERNTPPQTHEPQMRAQTQHAAHPGSKAMLLCPPLQPPPAPRRRRTSPSPLSHSASRPSSSSSSPLPAVLPGFENSYFPAPERYDVRSGTGHPLSSDSEEPSSRETWQSKSSESSFASRSRDQDPFGFRAYETPGPPRLVVNSPDEELPPAVPSPLSPDFTVEAFAPDPDPQEPPPIQGRARSTVAYVDGYNFSRPRISIHSAEEHDAQARPDGLFPSHSYTASPSRALPPPPPPTMSRAASADAVRLPPRNPPPSAWTRPAPPPPIAPYTSIPTRTPTSPPEISPYSITPSSSHSTTSTASTASPLSPLTPVQAHPRNHPRGQTNHGYTALGLPARPPSPVYSEYSFYSLGTDEPEPELEHSTTTSESHGSHEQHEEVRPTTGNSARSAWSSDGSVRGRYHKFHRGDTVRAAQQQQEKQQPSQPSKQAPPRPARNPARTRDSSSLSSLSSHTHTTTSSTLLTPQAYLQLGITAHESNNLPLAASYFERAAKYGGGCAVGMVMWGLTLRHAWGARKDEARGFKWLSRAAEIAVKELEEARDGRECAALQSELVLAVSEVAQCFMHGWGVTRDKKMGFNYFMVAAKLGDADAQQELGFCYANGRGCKKDMKEAAKWYRKAVTQGLSNVGLAWIYKSKYD